MISVIGGEHYKLGSFAQSIRGNANKRRIKSMHFSESSTAGACIRCVAEDGKEQILYLTANGAVEMLKGIIKHLRGITMYSDEELMALLDKVIKEGEEERAAIRTFLKDQRNLGPPEAEKKE